jgi:NAD(P)-dependent dehydrogenase (short-subunit alcohol dehydrogenase family)
MSPDDQSRERAFAGSLAGEVAVVTGGSRGIGRAVVELFAAEGAAVAFCARKEEPGASLQRELEHMPVLFQTADVASEADLAALIQTCNERFGPPTILVNNAGVNSNADPSEMTLEEWDAVFAVDLRSAWLAAKHALPHMRAAGRGAIVNVSSIHAFATAKGYFPYAAAKAGLIGLTRSLALDYSEHNIRVNAVAPGFVRTSAIERRFEATGHAQTAELAMTTAIPLGRLGATAEVAQVIRFLASEDASYVTGAYLVADGGLTAQRPG